MGGHRLAERSPGDGDVETPLAGLVATAVSGATLLVAFGGLALGIEHFWVAFPVGFGFVLPAALGVLRYRGAQSAGSGRAGGRDPSREPLEALRLRYAQGDLTEAEFQRRVERLLETESQSMPQSAPTSDPIADRDGTDRFETER